MSQISRSLLTPRDLNLLESILGSSDVRHSETYERLLANKVSTAIVIPLADIDPRVVTLNSRVSFAVGTSRPDWRILVSDDSLSVPGLTLSVMTLRGLAMLGRFAGEQISVEQPDGRLEVISINDVLFQPDISWTYPVDNPIA